MIIGVARNPYSPRVPDRLLKAARKLGIGARVIDMASLTTSIHPDGRASVADGQGVLEVDSVAPYLLFRFSSGNPRIACPVLECAHAESGRQRLAC